MTNQLWESLVGEAEKAALRVLVRLILANIVLVAATATVFMQSHVVYAGEVYDEKPISENIVGPSNIEVRIDSGLLTLHAENASLAEVLTEVGKQAGLEIFLEDDLDVSVTNSFSNEPLPQAIARLLGDITFVMVYGSAQQDERPPPLIALRVYGDSAGQAAPVDADELDTDQSVEANIARRAVALGLGPTSDDDSGLYDDLAGHKDDERVHAMQWLGDLGDDAAINALGRFLALDHQPAIRGEAALALGNIGGEAASKALELGLGDEDPDVRFQVVEAMGEIGGSSSTFVLGQIIFGESDPEVRMSALASLGRVRSEAARAFLEAATEDPNHKVREIAYGILYAWN